jgi:hypothetical protein
VTSGDSDRQQEDATTFFSKSQPRPAFREDTMLDRRSIGAIAILAMFWATMCNALAWDDAKYPNLKGQWRVVGGPMRYDGPSHGGQARKPH